MTTRISLQNAKINGTTIIGSIICRTPISPFVYEKDGKTIDNRCILIRNEDELISMFGDPYINPIEYADLIIANNILAAGVPLYISSINEMHDTTGDGFNTCYNGYTEFTFKDKNKHKSVSYKLKSNIKFCQPVINSVFNVNTLDLYVSLYLINIDAPRQYTDLNRLNPVNLYKTIRFTYDVNKATDKDIIEDFALNGLELQIYNYSKPTSLLDAFKQYSMFKVSLSHDETDGYLYDLHTDKYFYDFEDDEIIYAEYARAINRISDELLHPHFLCLSNLYRSKTVNDTYSSESGEVEYISYSQMKTLSADLSLLIQNYLLDSFDSESDTYLFISAPDLSFETTYNILTNSTGEYTEYPSLNDQYNADLYFGYAGFYIESSLVQPKIQRVKFNASILTLCSMIINQTLYSANSIENFNISNDFVKSIISESSADKLANIRCNSIVTFETGLPTTYGNRSLSTLPNLRYSNISRSFVYIRRLIREYLETRKFTINTVYNAQNCINYIQHYLLQQYVDLGILSAYSTSHSIKDKTVFIKINLVFVRAIESISLNFTI